MWWLWNSCIYIQKTQRVDSNTIIMFMTSLLIKEFTFMFSLCTYLLRVVADYQQLTSHFCSDICSVKQVEYTMCIRPCALNCTHQRGLIFFPENSTGMCFVYITTVLGQPAGLSKEVCVCSCWLAKAHRSVNGWQEVGCWLGFDVTYWPQQHFHWAHPQNPEWA